MTLDEAEALVTAIRIADAALRHDEMAIDLLDGEGYLDDEEAQEERIWISDQRATLDSIRGIVTQEWSGAVRS